MSATRHIHPLLVRLSYVLCMHQNGTQRCEGHLNPSEKLVPHNILFLALAFACRTETQPKRKMKGVIFIFVRQTTRRWAVCYVLPNRLKEKLSEGKLIIRRKELYECNGMFYNNCFRKLDDLSWKQCFLVRERNKQKTTSPLKSSKNRTSQDTVACINNEFESSATFPVKYLMASKIGRQSSGKSRKQRNERKK